MAIRAVVGVLACTICLVTATTLSAQSKAPSRSPSADAGHISSMPGLLRKAVSETGVPLARSNAVAPQQPPRREKSNAVAWGPAIGAAAGVTGGLVQPTHSNGEYVLASDRMTSAIVLGGVGVGIGALIGWAIDKAR
jgi:hypothetical protein